MEFFLWLWRLWKWLVRLLTGKCELYRLCYWKAPLEQKTQQIEQSLKISKSQALRGLVREGGVEVEECVQVIAREKKINLGAHPGFAERLRPCLMRVEGVCVLWGEVEGVRRENYSQENQDHERMLLELWSHLMPDTPLESRMSKQWQEIGFQGNNPATDFRGMGVLSLHCLLYFATAHQDRARSILSHSHHPQYSYPFALVGIHLTGLAHSWVVNGSLNYYLYSTCTEWPVPLEEFMEIVCYLFVQFDRFWLEKKPENVMVFPRVKEEFAANISRILAAKTIKCIMRLQ